MRFPPNAAPPISNPASIPPYHPMQSTLGTPTFSQYGMPLTNSFPGPGQFGLQPGYQFQQFGFPMATNHYPPPANPASYGSWAVPNYHHAQPLYHPYENIQPTNYPHANWQPAISSRPMPPTLNTYTSSPNLHRFRSPSPPTGTSSAEDRLEFPELKDWLEGVDRDNLRGRWGHHFSQLSARFELDGLTSLLDLEGIPVDKLVSETGISEEAGQRLLRFAQEDINEVRDNGFPRAKRGRYSY